MRWQRRANVFPIWSKRQVGDSVCLYQRDPFKPSYQCRWTQTYGNGSGHGQDWKRTPLMSTGWIWRYLLCGHRFGKSDAKPTPVRISYCVRDVIEIPEYNNTVRISGAVMYPNTVSFEDSKTLKYYIEQAGGYGFRCEERAKVYIVYMNGQVKRAERKVAVRADPAGLWWLFQWRKRATGLCRTPCP